MIKTRLYNTNLPYSYENDQRSPGKMTLIVISPEIYSYVRSHVNSRSLEDIQNEYLSQHIKLGKAMISQSKWRTASNKLLATFKEVFSVPLFKKKYRCYPPEIDEFTHDQLLQHQITELLLILVSRRLQPARPQNNYQDHTE